MGGAGVIGPGYQFAPEERPVFPGAPAAPAHPLGRRLTYALIAVIVGISATLGNALVTVNLVNLQGGLSLYTTETSWLPAVYVAMNASANLLLVKARIQFGIPAVTCVLLLGYAAAAYYQLVHPSFGAAILVRAVSGMTAAGLTTLTLYNMVQAIPAKIRPVAFVLGIGIPQLGVPLARMFPPELLALDRWRGLHLMELGLALVAFTALAWLPLPPSERRKAFEPLDFITFALFAPAMLLLCGVLGLGRLVWWTDVAWTGWALAAAVPLFAAVILIEHNRANPLLRTEWIASTAIVRFAAVALMVRLALAEQTYGAVGLLTAGGLTNEQLRTLFAIVLAAMILGTLASAAVLNPNRLTHQVVVASLLIAVGAWLDSGSTSATRPAQLYVSQAFTAFGASFFIGPALLYGLLRVLQRGPEILVSFIVLFNITQNVGGLAGSALLGTYQVMREKAHSHALVDHLTLADPLVAGRVQGGAAAVSGVIVDPGLRGAEGAALLGQSATREANILAFDDVFQLVAVLALLTALFLVGVIILRERAQRRAARAAAAPA